MLVTSVSVNPSRDPRTTRSSDGSSGLRTGYCRVSISSAVCSPSINNALMPVSVLLMASLSFSVFST
ncbi:hypothetical protein D3C76_1386380 [compost metagenome]